MRFVTLQLPLQFVRLLTSSGHARIKISNELRQVRKKVLCLELRRLKNHFRCVSRLLGAQTLVMLDYLSQIDRSRVEKPLVPFLPRNCTVVETGSS